MKKCEMIDRVVAESVGRPLFQQHPKACSAKWNCTEAYKETNMYFRK